MEQVSQQKAIPKLELEEFRFSPPGSMGWSYAEYEKILDGQAELEVDTTSSLHTPPIPTTNLKELPPGDGTVNIPFVSSEELSNESVSEEPGDSSAPPEEASIMELSEIEEVVPNVEEAPVAEETPVVQETHGEVEEKYALRVRTIGRPRNLGKSRYRCPVMNQQSFFQEDCGCEEPIVEDHEELEVEDVLEVEETIEDVTDELEIEEVEDELPDEEEVKLEEHVINEDEDEDEDDDDEDEDEDDDDDDDDDEDDEDDEDEDEDNDDCVKKVRVIDSPTKASSIWVPA